MRRNIASIRMAVPLPYLLITLKAVDSQKFLLVICKISRLFPNTLSADGKYPLLNRDDLTQPIQVQLSRKEKTFSEFFVAFFKSSSNFEHFQKQDDSHS